MLPLFQRLQHSEFIVAINSSVPMASALEIAHYLSFFLLTGLIVFLDLRTLGLAGTQLPLKTLAKQTFSWIWIGFATATASGFLMFAADATEYVGNSVFHKKLMVFLLGLVLAGTLERLIRRWEESPYSTIAKLVAVASLFASIGTILLGVDVPALTGVG